MVLLWDPGGALFLMGDAPQDSALGGGACALHILLVSADARTAFKIAPALSAQFPDQATAPATPPQDRS
jgi:hypothetical protein